MAPRFAVYTRAIMTDPSRPQISVAWALCLLAAPVLVQGVTRVLSDWSGAPHPALAVTLAALAPVLVAGLVALIRARSLASVAWAAAALAGAALWTTSAAPMTAVAAAALAGWVAARWLPRIASAAPVPRGRVTAALWGVLAVVAVVQVGRMSVFMADPLQRYGALAPTAEFAARHSCLSSYVHGAELARRGDANIYDDRYGYVETGPGPELQPVITTGPLTMDTYEYPPQFLPLPRLMLAISRDFMAIRALWFLMTAAVFVAVSLTLARWLGGEAERRALLLIPAMFLAPPLLMTAYFGNFQLMAMGLAALAMLWISRGRTRRGAALLAFVIGAKIFPGILGVYLLAARRFAAAAWTAAFAALYAAGTLVLFGTRPFVDFFGYHLPRLASGETFAFLSGPAEAMTNLGVFGLPFKLRVAGWSGSEADAWALARQLSWGYTLVIVLLAAWAGWRAHSPADAHARVRIAGAWFGLLALAALRSPFAPPEALIPLVWALALSAAAARTRREVALVVALWIVMMILLPVPAPAAAIVSLTLQATIYATATWLVLRSRRAA